MTGNDIDKMMMKDITPFTNLMVQFLLINALRGLTNQQRAILCSSLYERCDLSIADKRINQVRLLRDKKMVVTPALAKGGIIHNPKLSIAPEKVINEKSNLNNLDSLFNFMVEEHDLILTEGQLSDITDEVNRF